MKINVDDALNSIQVYPNPVHNKKINLYLNYISAGAYIISVYDVHGKNVYTQFFQHSGGNTSVPINLNTATAGTYFIEINGNNKSYHTSIGLQ